MSTELIIFDCDGVLVDTERVANEVTREVLATYGWQLSLKNAVDLFMGRSDKDAVTIIAEHLGAESAKDYLLTWRKIAAERMTKVEAIPGVKDSLDWLEPLDLKTCVASSGTHEKMRRTLPSAGLFDYFEGRIFSASEVQYGKPAPDLFLHAAEQMNVKSERCLVIEDSVPGVRAAVAAGMQVFGHADLNKPETLRAAGATEVGGMLELADFLKRTLHQVSARPL